MSDLAWWDEASVEQKEQIVRWLNEEKILAWPFPLPKVRVWNKDRARAEQRIQHGLPVRHSLELQVRSDQKIHVEHYRRVGKIQEWKYGVELPADIRRCQHKCLKFFLVSKSRPNRIYFSRKCASNYHASKTMNARIQKVRDRKLKRVRLALKVFGYQLDWKERTARRARVTRNFITYAVRRGELPDWGKAVSKTIRVRRCQ
jgi:hypothetical protein